MDLGDTMAQATPCCVHLRCKSMYYRGDERPGMLHHENAMTYWCAKTNEDVGPDGEAVLHLQCQAGRACHEKAPSI